MRETTLIVIIGIMITWTLLSPTSLVGAEAGDPVVIIKIDQDEQSMSVGPGNDRTVIFTGIVEADTQFMARVQTLTLTMLYKCRSTVWLVDGTPEVIVLSKENRSMPFSCSVSLAPGSQYYNPDMLTIGGYWTSDPGYDGGDAFGDNAIVSIIPFSNPVIEPVDTVQKVKAGEVAEFRLDLKNLGYGTDDYSIDISGDGLFIECDLPDRVKMDTGDLYSFTIKVSSKTEGLKALDIIVTGTNGGYVRTDNCTLQLEVINTKESGYDPYPLLGIMIFFILAVASIALVYVVRNGKR